MDFSDFLSRISIWAIPLLFAITLHEVAHGWAARYCGDRTAELLGRLSLNPLRHIDPVGTLLVPGLLLLVGGPLIGWARPVPVAATALRNPRRAMMLIAFAGPLANLVMALVWCAVLAGVVRLTGNATLIDWFALMARAGIIANVVLALFNLLPIPPLDGGRILTGLLPIQLGARLERLAPYTFFLVLGLSALGLLGWLFDPAYRLVGHFVGLIGATA